MSKSRIMKIVCPKCGCKQEVLVWDAVNISQNPELEHDIITGDIFKLTCHDCNGVTFLGYNMLYHDPEKKYIINFVHNEEGLTETFKLFNLLKNGKIHEEIGTIDSSYQMRAVKTLPDFIEKIAIFNNHLDDRIITLIKAFYSMTYSQKNHNETADHLYFTINSENQKLILFYQDKKEIASAEVGDKIYQIIQEKYHNKIEEADAYLIDFDWAVNLLTEEI